MKVYITKYWQTKGILVAEADLCAVSDKMIAICRGYRRVHYFHRPDWHETLPEAEERVRLCIIRARKNLMRRLDKIDHTKLTPTPWEADTP